MNEGRGQTSAGGNVLRRLGLSLQVMHGRLWRRAEFEPAVPIWTGGMTLLFVCGLCMAFALTWFDEWITRQAIAYESSALGYMQMLTRAGLSQVYLVPAAVVLIAAGALDWRKRTMRAKSKLLFYFGQAAFVVAAVAISGLLTNVLKILIGRARPGLLEQYGSFHFEPLTVQYSYASFPSGHSTTAGAVALIFVLWFPRLKLPILAVGLAVAASRVGVEAHYASDVVAGFTLGFLVALFIARWLGARGLVFQLATASLLPGLRHLKGNRTAAGNRSTGS